MDRPGHLSRVISRFSIWFWTPRIIDHFEENKVRNDLKYFWHSEATSNIMDFFPHVVENWLEQKAFFNETKTILIKV